MNNKPLAAQALAELLAALEPADAREVLKATIKPLCAAVADGKKGMREAAVLAIDRGCTFGEPAGEPPEYPSVDPKALEVAIKGMAGKEEGLVKTVARLELLEWASRRFPALPVGTSMGDLVPQLLQCMNDKDSKVRAFADTVVGIMVAKKGAKKSAIDKELSALSGSMQRTTKVSMRCDTAILFEGKERGEWLVEDQRPEFP